MEETKREPSERAVSFEDGHLWRKTCPHSSSPRMRWYCKVCRAIALDAFEHEGDKAHGRGNPADYIDDLRSRLADTERKLREAEAREVQTKARLGCIARVSLRHEDHGCPADDCLECWPTDVANELRDYAAIAKEQP